MTENMDVKSLKLSSIAIGVLSFVLIFFGFIEGTLLVLGFSILIQRDPWLTKQVLEALYLRIVYLLGIMIVDWLFKGLLFILNLADAYKAMDAVLKIQAFFEGLFYIALLVVVVMAVMKILKGKDAGIPIISSFAAKTLGDEIIIKNEPPIIHQEKESVIHEDIPIVIKQKDAPKEVQCEDGLWRCNCGAENFGNFCMTCGKGKDEREVSE